MNKELEIVGRGKRKEEKVFWGKKLVEKIILKF